MKQNLTTVCYPIRPVYSERIMSGEKKYELRKRLPNNKINHILIYATTPVAKVVGYADVKEVYTESVYEIWDRVSLSAGISEEDYMKYFNGKQSACAIELENVRRFKKPFNIKEINKNLTVPQSFCYVKDEDFKKITRRSVENV